MGAAWQWKLNSVQWLMKTDNWSHSRNSRTRATENLLMADEENSRSELQKFYWYEEKQSFNPYSFVSSIPWTLLKQPRISCKITWHGVINIQWKQIHLHTYIQVKVGGFQGILSIDLYSAVIMHYCRDISRWLLQEKSQSKIIIQRKR